MLDQEKFKAVGAEFTRLRNSLAVMEANVQKGTMTDVDLDHYLSAMQKVNRELDPNPPKPAAAKR